MKKLAMVTYVFGKKYQSFIPSYIYCINKVYPEYDIFVYVDKKLQPSVKAQINELKLNNYAIERLNIDEVKIPKRLARNRAVAGAVRFLLIPEKFKEYEAVYYGDIDILICNEKYKLFDSHMQHCEYLGLPYSNVIREITIGFNSIGFIATILQNGLFRSLSTLKIKEKRLLRLTGLHFIKLNECYDSIKQSANTIVEELKRVDRFKSEKWDLYHINDEAILYELMNESKLGLPPYERTDKDYPIINEIPNSVSFRPHHGLHLAYWRTDFKGKIHPNDKVVHSKLYESYFNDFYQKYSEDESFRRIIAKYDTFANRAITRMIDYYGKHK